MLHKGGTVWKTYRSMNVANSMINVSNFASPTEHIWDMDTHIDDEPLQKN